MKAWVTPGTSRRTPSTEPQGGGEGREGDGQLRHARGECRRRCARARYPSKIALGFLGDSCRWYFGIWISRWALRIASKFGLTGLVVFGSGFPWLVGSPRIAKHDLFPSFCCDGFWFISILTMSILLQNSIFLGVHSKSAA